MKNHLSQLLLYQDLGHDPLLAPLAGGEGAPQPQALTLVEFAARYGLSGNLWQLYLAWLLATSENPFSLSAEGRQLEDCTLSQLARADCEHLQALFQLDLAALPGGSSFAPLADYRSPALGRDYYSPLRQVLEGLAGELARAQTGEEFFQALSRFYQTQGAGVFALSHSFRVEEGPDGPRLEPVYNARPVTLDQLIGYDSQKAQLVENTAAFVSGLPGNNVLLYGDAGTGKSTCVRGVLNRFAPQGLRMIQFHKGQFHLLSPVIAQIKERNCKFILFIDDLSFEEHEVEYKYLKAVIEGGVESRPDNVLIYATSNRRHLIRENWEDRSDMEHRGEIHRSDTVEEKTSLSARFGVAINFNAPNVDQFRQIVLGLAREQLSRNIDEDQLIRQAHTWELRHGGRSGRTAQQFIHHLQGKGV